VTSSQPVTTPQALNFTPDNKHCYAYNTMAFSDDASTLLEFTTQSEYSVIDFLPMRNDTDSLDSKHRMFFNDELVLTFPLSSGGSGVSGPCKMVIPPFTKVLVTVQNVSNTSGGNGSIAITGKTYGMTETGYQ